MAIGLDHVLLCGPPKCGKTTYANKHMPADAILIQQPFRGSVSETTKIYLESTDLRDNWAKQCSYGSYFTKVVYWTKVDYTQEPEIITRSEKDKERWLWFWGLN
jgi:hypothetical protein